MEAKGNEVDISVRDNLEDQRNYAVSFEKIRSILGYKAKTMLDEGIQEMVTEFQQGTYKDYRDESYSNVAITEKAVDEFRDPMLVAGLYTPLAK